MQKNSPPNPFASFNADKIPQMDTLWKYRRFDIVARLLPQDDRLSGRKLEARDRGGGGEFLGELYKNPEGYINVLTVANLKSLSKLYLQQVLNKIIFEERSGDKSSFVAYLIFYERINDSPRNMRSLRSNAGTNCRRSCGRA